MSHLSALIASLGCDDPDFSVERRPGGGRSSAVLALISEERNDIVLTRRPLSLRHHAGQVALPGGRAENTDETIVDTALREAHEEVGLDRRLVTVRGVLPTAHVLDALLDRGGWSRPWDRERMVEIPEGYLGARRLPEGTTPNDIP